MKQKIVLTKRILTILFKEMYTSKDKTHKFDTSI